MIKTMRPVALSLALAASLAACTSTGIGSGELAHEGQPDEPAVFSWTSTDGGISGTMTATLPDAVYEGRFFQITQQTQSEALAPMWDGWDRGWTNWPYWGPLDADQFTTRYSGKVVANLQSPTGQRMRCRLHLVKPAEGMEGGGDGECQLRGGGTIHAQF